MLELLVFLGMGALFAGFGFLLKAVQMHPLHAALAAAAAFALQLVVLRQSSGRVKARARPRKDGKASTWTLQGLLAEFIPVVMAASILAGVAGATGVAGADAVPYIETKLERQAAVALMVVLPAACTWRHIAQVVDDACLARRKPPPPEQAADGTTKKTKNKKQKTMSDAQMQMIR